MSNWSHLHESMLSLVAANLTDVNDHLTFSGVCSSWRSAALYIRSTFPCPLPDLMVRGEDDHGYCISLSHGRKLHKKLRIPHGDWYVGCHGGWLVTVHENLEMSLYNPFSNDILPLPSITSVPKFGEADYNKDNQYVESAALSSSDINVSPKDLTVVLVQGAYRRVAFAKPGDSSWKIIEFEDDEGHFYYSDVTYYKGKFYAVGYRGTIVCDDIELHPKISLLFPVTNPNPPTGYKSPEVGRRYLIEAQGDLIMVERWITYNDEDISKINSLCKKNGSGDNIGSSSTIENTSVENDEGMSDILSNERWTYRTMFFTAYKADFASQCWAPLKGIGYDQVFFVGVNSALALKVEVGKGNRIYFTDDNFDGQGAEMIDHGKLYTNDMGVFDLSDGTIVSHVDVGDAALYPPPIWLIRLPW